MSTPNRIALTPNGRVAESSRGVGSVILTYCVALPLFGRAVFPLARDKAHITLASSFTDPQILATYVVAAVVTLRLCTASNLFRRTNSGRVTSMFMLFVAACLVSSFGSRFPLFSIWRCFEVLLLSSWAVVMTRDIAMAGHPQGSIRAFYTISVAILVGVFVGLIINPSGAWSMEGDVSRLTGTTGYSINPNDIGAIAAVIAVGCYVRAVEGASLKHLLATAMFIVVCYLSHSRGSYIALMVGFAAATYMLARLPQRRPVIFLMCFGVLLSVGAIVLVSHEVRDFFVFLMTRGHETENLESLGGRLQVWEFGLKIFGLHPYLGTGYGTYPEGLEGGHFHNVLIELLVTTGAFGAASYAAFIMALIGTIKRSIARTNLQMVAERIVAADLVTIPAVVIVANGATAGAAYYSWDLLGLMSVTVASSLFMVRTNPLDRYRVAPARFSNLLQ